MLCIYINLRSQDIKNELKALGLLPKKESFTELYFTDHLKLPSTMGFNQRISFQFTVHNLENKNMDYPYEVFIVANGQPVRVLDKNTLSIRNQSSKTITEAFSSADIATHSAVVVNLPNNNQQIDFWVNPYISIVPGSIVTRKRNGL